MNDHHYSEEENTKTAVVVTAVFYGAGFTILLATLYWVLTHWPTE